MKCFPIEFPEFIRFSVVSLCYYTPHNTCSLTIDKKCQSFVNKLEPIKKQLNDAQLIQFIVGVNRNSRTDFADCPALLDHLHNRLLPICEWLPWLCLWLPIRYLVRVKNGKESCLKCYCLNSPNGLHKSELVCQDFPSRT